jgi:hypothetical protein
MDDYTHLRLHTTTTRQAVRAAHANGARAKRRTPAARRVLGALAGVVRGRKDRRETQLSPTDRSRRAASA